MSILYVGALHKILHFVTILIWLGKRGSNRFFIHLHQTQSQHTFWYVLWLHCWICKWAVCKIAQALIDRENEIHHCCYLYWLLLELCGWYFIHHDKAFNIFYPPNTQEILQDFIHHAEWSWITYTNTMSQDMLICFTVLYI